MESSVENINDKETLEKTIASVKMISPSHHSLLRLVDRLDCLKKLENLASSSNRRSFFSDKDSLKQAISFAKDHKLTDHSIILKANKLLSLNARSFVASAIAQAVVANDALTVAVYTVQLKLPYLALESSVLKYKLENFPFLRAASAFGVRMNVTSLDLQKNMLFHSNQPLPTSLTRLSPSMAALSVWMFTHCICAIEKNAYSHTDVQLKKLLRLGSACLPMRDEIYLQLVKQTRNLTSEDGSSNRLIWRLICFCLHCFPPSKTFEPFLESYFLSRIRENNNPVCVFAKFCLVALHKIVFKRGYKSKIIDFDLNSISNDVSKLMTVMTEQFSFERHTAKKGHTIESKESINDFVCRHLDDKFQTIIASSSLSSSQILNLNAMSVVCGTREDWEVRFARFNPSKVKIDSKESFAERTADFLLSNSQHRDGDVFRFLLFGRYSETLSVIKKALKREMEVANALFHFKDDKEKEESMDRRKRLMNDLRIPPKSCEASLIELDSRTLLFTASAFWEVVSRRERSVFDALFYRDLVLTGMKIYVTFSIS